METQLRCFQRLASQHASEGFVKIMRSGCWGYHRSLFHKTTWNYTNMMCVWVVGQRIIMPGPEWLKCDTTWFETVSLHNCRCFQKWCSMWQDSGPGLVLFLLLAGVGGFLSSSGANVMAWSEYQKRKGKDSPGRRRLGRHHFSFGFAQGKSIKTHLTDCRGQTRKLVFGFNMF